METWPTLGSNTFMQHGQTSGACLIYSLHFGMNLVKKWCPGEHQNRCWLIFSSNSRTLIWKIMKIWENHRCWPIRKSVLKQQFQLSCVKRNISWVLPSGTGKSKIAPWSSIIALEMEFFLARRMDYKSCTKRMVARCWKPMNNGYPLVMTNIAIENDHRNSEFSH